MNLLLIAATVCVGVYTAAMLAIARSVASFRPTTSASPTELPPSMAIIVAARDEEDNLSGCLDALLAQNYQQDRFSIFVADDHSTDGTADVIQQYRSRSTDAAGPAIHYVAVPKAEGHLRGKANALHAAIQASEAEFILVTDADCAPPPDWAANHAAYFSDPTVGMVCGHTYVKNETVLDRLQALDWTYLLTSASVLSEAGYPVTAMGNNMGIRRDAYNTVGGYPALPFSVTEDYVLFKAVALRSDYRVRFPVDPSLQTLTLPLGRWVDVYNQRLRWARGGLRAPVWVFALYILVFLVHLLPLLGLIYGPFWALSLLAVKAAGDFFLLALSLSLSRRASLLRSFPLFEGYLFFYMISLPLVLLLRRKTTWKNRRF